MLSSTIHLPQTKTAPCVSSSLCESFEFITTLTRLFILKLLLVTHAHIKIPIYNNNVISYMTPCTTHTFIKYFQITFNYAYLNLFLHARVLETNLFAPPRFDKCVFHSLVYAAHAQKTHFNNIQFKLENIYFITKHKFELFLIFVLIAQTPIKLC